MVGAEEENFKVKRLRWDENDILRLIFANTVFGKRTILQDIPLYLDPTIGPTKARPAEKVQSKGSQMVGKGNFHIGFSKYSTYFL